MLCGVGFPHLKFGERMNANAVSVLQLFEKKMSLEVPLFQRQYVWSCSQQWEPLWEDISTKFLQTLDGRHDAPVHFLGAMVLDQKQTPSTHVEKRQIIDGQQRLTTLQIFLAAFRDFCASQDKAEIAKECSSFILNSGMMANKDVDKFKVWPTQRDRDQFRDVMELQSFEAVYAKYPLIKLKYRRNFQPRPRMVEAYTFFYEQFKEFFLSPLHAERNLEHRLEACLSTLKSALKVVVIDLDGDDDAQVIFETLNARGEPLLPADLLRNYIFLRASGKGKTPEELYELYWARFDDSFWRHEIRQGRLVRPRSDLFMQHFLASRQAEEIPIKNLFVEYKYWIDKVKPFANVEDELAALAKQGEQYRSLIQPKKDDPLYRLSVFLQTFDMSTLYPLLLKLLDVGFSALDWSEISKLLESYVLRRAMCGFTTKSYNRTFLALTKIFTKEKPTVDRIRGYLTNLGGESGVWPSDQQFTEAWYAQNAYATLQSGRLVYVLKVLNDAIVNKKMEDITVNSPLTVEHIMPQAWQANWPLPDGTQGMSWSQLLSLDPNDPVAAINRLRNGLVQTMGNLTLLTSPLNASVSHGNWTTKRSALLKASLLPINLELQQYSLWNEDTIIERSKTLANVARTIWIGPAAEG